MSYERWLQFLRIGTEFRDRKGRTWRKISSTRFRQSEGGTVSLKKLAQTMPYVYISKIP